MHRAIVDASLETDTDSTRWASVVWSQAIEPLLEAGRERRSVVWDLSYEISVHPDHVLPSGGAAIPVTFVATRLRSRRMLPVGPDGTIWVSATRTTSALHNEFQMGSCLLRELVPLSGVEPSAWREMILASCQVKLIVNGSPVALQTSGDDPIPDIVRWEARIDPADVTDGYVTVEISFDYPMDAVETDFPVMFPRYYCAGTTRIAFTLYAPEDADLELRAHSFLAHALDQRTGDTELDRTPMLQRFVFESAPDALLWPGSGVQFEWPSRAAQVGT